MAADLWLPGVQRLDCSAYGLALGKGNNTEAYHTWHTFEGVPADYNFTALRGAQYLARTLKLAHFTFNPVLGGLVQMLPANVAARTLAATTDPRYDVNRRGRRHMQTETIANARRPFTLDMTRAGLDDLTRLMNFLRSHGVEDQWAWREVIRPPANYAEANAPGNRRMPDRSGHAFHSKWPVPPGVGGHWDPGAIAAPWTLVSGAAATVPEWPKGWIADRQTQLNALGYTGRDGRPLTVDDSLGPDTQHATRTYQTDRGLDPDGLPGPTTTAALEADMATLQDLATVTLRGPAAAVLGIAPGDYDLGWVLEVIVRNAVQAKRYALAAMRNEVDPGAVADALREDVTRAVTEAGSGATADQIVDALLARLTAAQEG